MQTVAAANPTLNVGVFVGYSTPLSGMPANFMMVGDYEEGLLWTPVEQDWASLPAAAKRRTEPYALQGCIRAYAGGYDWSSRLTEAFTMLNALQELIVSDPQAGGALTPSGGWGRLEYRNVVNGPLIDSGGFGVVIGFELHVITAQLTG